MDISNIEVFTQSSIRIRCSAGTIYADPFRMNESPRDADIVLITHDENVARQAQRRIRIRDGKVEEAATSDPYGDRPAGGNASDPYGGRPADEEAAR